MRSKKRTSVNNGPDSPTMQQDDPALDSLLDALQQPDPAVEAMLEDLRRQPGECPLCGRPMEGATP